MEDFTLRQLHYALAVAGEAHFGRAAERSHVTQSALSQQVKQLELALGAQIFERRSRDVRPTAFGREFLARAGALIRDANALGRFAAEHRGVPSRPLRFGLIPTIAPYLLPEIFPALQETVPGTSFIIRESQTDPLLDALDRGDLDLALPTTGPPDAARMSSVELFADPFYLATGLDSDLRGPVTLARLEHSRILLLDEGHCFRDQAVEACALRDVAAQNFAATSLSTIVEFVANGQGVTLLPAISLKKETVGNRIRVLPLTAPGAGRTLRLVWPKSSPFADLFRNIAGTIRETGQNAFSLPEIA